MIFSKRLATTKACLGGLLWWVLASFSIASDSVAVEIQVKSAMLYRFIRFATWPSEAFEDSQAPLQLCALVDSRWHESLMALTQKKVHERSIRVRLDVETQAETEVECHVLLVEGEQASAFNPQAGDVPMLTITDGEVSEQQRGMIHFVRQDAHVRFVVNLAMVRAAGMNLDANMLAYALRVIR